MAVSAGGADSPHPGIMNWWRFRQEKVAVSSRKCTTPSSAIESFSQITSSLWVSIFSSVKWAVQLDY